MTTKKYMLDEMIIDKFDKVIEYGQNHYIKIWDELPTEEEIRNAIKDSIRSQWEFKHAWVCEYTLVEGHIDEEGYTMGGLKYLKKFKYEIDKARKNKSECEYKIEEVNYYE